MYCDHVQVFLNVATGGFGTEMTTKTDEGLKNSLGGLAYAITGMHADCLHVQLQQDTWLACACWGPIALKVSICCHGCLSHMQMTISARPLAQKKGDASHILLGGTSCYNDVQMCNGGQLYC